MANPAPTINQINAFNVTQGTTIDFNIIGGTELVRSNRIYIYDLSDNSLICTHLYVSTESIHELPASTDSSIVYESGKSSANFVNGAQYYAQIQTYTDTTGTQGGSGLSVAKMFWCLVDPTLTITTIPSTISTTSYNVSATYDANTSVVSNIIQQYQFSLYSATGSLLQSSGVVVGSGTQQGTSTAYDISYNFSGLSVGSSYYVVVDVTTTQGMSVSTQSSTFTVSIDTPTLGEATVVNNACDGYISVTSNLSGEYGGSGSGEIVSFETDSENVFTKLQVDLEPIQDLHGYDAPWVGGAGKNLYPIEIGEEILVNNGSATHSNDNGTLVIATEASQGASGVYLGSAAEMHEVIDNAELPYTVSMDIVASASGDVRVVFCGASQLFTIGTSVQRVSVTATSGTTRNFNIYGANNGATLRVSNLQIEKGSTATTYAPYENICPISGRDSVLTYRTGKNLIDSANAISGVCGYRAGHTIDTVVSNTRYSHSEAIPADSGLVVSFRSNDVSTFDAVLVECFDSNGDWVCAFAHAPVTDTTTVKTIVVPANTYKWVKVVYGAPAGGIVGTNISGEVQLELGSTATAYEPYAGQSYTTALGRTVYGGTLDLVSGILTVTHKFFNVTNTMLTNATYVSGASNASSYYYNLANVIAGSDRAPSTFTLDMGAWGDKLEARQGMYSDRTVEGFTVSGRYVSIRINSSRVSDTSGASLASYLTSLDIVYPLNTPITYQLTPQQIQTIVGVNNVWSEQGDVELSYHIPITNLLVKRQDVGDVSGDWLTLYSQPITQASDMDFTFIDFTNQYGKTYKYALVPLLTQTQSGVEVEVEGGYTVSDEVQSVFDGVFIVDSTGSQKCKANVGYGNVDMNQMVGSITPIGAKYPIVITNSQNQYHNGSISGTIVPDDYYFNGNLSRIDMVNKHNELEQFLTNKRAKIIKDWNGNIWLVMIMDNVSCTFNNNYGMGIVNFSTSWVEVGDPTNQQDLQATGLINIGGV